MFKYSSPKYKDENYQTGNPVIRFLLCNLMRKMSYLLRQIDSHVLRGLDVGCGEGYLLAHLYREGIIGNMTAIDLNENKLTYARKHHPFCKYHKADVVSLMFESDTFDYIMASEIFEHLPKAEDAMEELRRVGKERAYLTISVPYEPFFHWGNLLRGKYWYRRGRTPAHLNFWNRPQFKSFLRKFLEIETEHHLSIFPWLLYLGRFKPK